MSLGVRAVVAVVLILTFYVIAFAAVIGSIALAAYLATIFDVARGRGVVVVAALLVLLLAVAFVVVWSVLPRRDRFMPPGPELTAAEHPRLFDEIRRIANATGQRVPAHVYATLQINASVAQRGGVLGIGSRRVMVLGLPLLRVLSVDELRGVLAHEMGHFAAGDTRLAPWIYKTRGAMIRILVNVSKLDRGWHAGWSTLVAIVRMPFHGVLLGYMRITEAISRAQELGADALAVRVVGRQAVISGLEKTHVANVAFETFLYDELTPILRLGVVPPFGEGFSRFLDEPDVKARLAETLEVQQRELVTEPYDSHPSLRDRIDALRALSETERDPDARPAIELVSDPATVELALIRGHDPLDEIAWEDVAGAYAKRWRADVAEHRKLLARYRTDKIPSDERRIYELAVEALGMAEANQLRPIPWWTVMVGGALAVILLDEGFTLSTKFREPLVFKRGDVTIDLFKEVDQLLNGMMRDGEWSALWRERGLPVRALA